MSESESHLEESAEIVFSNSEDSDSEDTHQETVNFKKKGRPPVSPVQSEKEASSDESQKECSRSGKRAFQPKVKIKTLTIDGQLVYFCKICDKIFTRRKDKLNHELAHSGESVLTCNECGKEYLHESSLASHMRTHDGDPLFMCDLCPKMFAQSHHLKSHILSHSEPTSFVCKTCYMEFATVSDLNHHCRIQIKMEMLKHLCKLCKVYMCRSHSLPCEKRLHAFICTACNEFFYTNKKLKIHMKKFAHFSTERPKCIAPLQEYELYPLKVSENLRKFTTQKEIEAMKKMEKNELCKQNLVEISEDEMPSKKFKLSARKIFLEEEHSSTSMQDSVSEVKLELDLKSPNKHRKGKPYCKKCNRSFKDTMELERHKAQVHNENGSAQAAPLSCNTVDKLHNCPVCGENFSCSLLLTKHLKSHSDGLIHKCTQCGKGFKHKIQLLQHLRLHLSQEMNMKETKLASCLETSSVKGGEGTFKCHLCNRNFPFHFQLLNHLQIHNKCSICHKTFATKHYLQRHLQVHIRQGLDVDISMMEGEPMTDLSNLDLDKAFPGCEYSQNSTVSSCDPGFAMNEKRSFDAESLMNPAFKLVSSQHIKNEPHQESDSDSENSSCSYMTRDSERSDPFRFSSDESNSFKTMMAKERRRLKRKWLRLSKQIQPLKKLKEEEDKCHPEMYDENGEDVMDMKVELNSVQSEVDNVMTVYVDLTHVKKLLVKMNENLLCVPQEHVLPQTVIKRELPDEVELREPDIHISKQEEVSIHAQATMSNVKVDMIKSPTWCLVNEEQRNETKVSDRQVLISHKQHMQYLSPPSSNPTEPSGSNLEKLKVAFEGSSKYLPSPGIPSSSSTFAYHSQDLAGTTTQVKLSAFSPSKSDTKCNVSSNINSNDNTISCLDSYHLDIDRPLVIDIPSDETSPRIKPPSSVVTPSSHSDSYGLTALDQRFDSRQGTEEQRTLNSSVPGTKTTSSNLHNVNTFKDKSSVSSQNTYRNSGNAVSSFVPLKSESMKVTGQLHTHASLSVRQVESKPKAFSIQNTQSSSSTIRNSLGNSIYTTAHKTQGTYTTANNIQSTFTKSLTQGTYITTHSSQSQGNYATAQNQVTCASTQSSQCQSTDTAPYNRQGQGTFSLNVSSIFDTNNPILRDMNMMDLVSPNQNSSSAAGHSSNLIGSAFNVHNSAFSVIQQNSIHPLDYQNIALYPQNVSVAATGPSVGMNLGMMGNQFSDVYHQNVGIANIASSQSNSLVTGNNFALPLRDSLPRESLLGSNLSIVPSLHINGPLSLSSVPHMSYDPNLLGVGSMGSLDPTGFLSLGGPLVSLPNGLPMNISSNPVFVNSFGGPSIGCSPFPGVQDLMANSSSSLGINLLNSSVLVPNVNGFLPGHSFPMLNNFNPGYFTQFP
ncbi:zinc finger protein 91 [Biomphalaria glabrata]|nr:zinc finger protein 91-like; partial [Biomphalaria glabrata]